MHQGLSFLMTSEDEIYVRHTSPYIQGDNSKAFQWLINAHLYDKIKIVIFLKGSTYSLRYLHA